MSFAPSLSNKTSWKTLSNPVLRSQYRSASSKHLLSPLVIVPVWQPLLVTWPLPRKSPGSTLIYSTSYSYWQLFLCNEWFLVTSWMCSHLIFGWAVDMFTTSVIVWLFVFIVMLDPFFSNVTMFRYLNNYFAKCDVVVRAATMIIFSITLSMKCQKIVKKCPL